MMYRSNKMKLTIQRFYSDNSFKQFEKELIADRDSINLPKNYQLVGANEYMSSSYYVHSGVLKFYIIANNGNEKTEWFIGPGGLFPLYSPLDRHYRNERDTLLVKAQTPVNITRIPQDTIDRLLDSDPAFSKRMLRQYADFSAILLYDIATLATRDSLTNTCNYLYQYEKLLKPHGVILTQEEIATNIGIPLLTFTRKLSWLRKNGIISTSRKEISILDWPKLIQHCSPDLLVD